MNRRLLPSLMWAGVLVTLTAVSAFAQTHAIWRGGTGNWVSENWSTSPNSYPNNTSIPLTYYDASIGSGNGDSVTLSSAVTIDTLTLGADYGTLTSTLTIASSGSLTVGVGPDSSAPLTLNSTGTLNVNGSLTLTAASGQTADVPIAGTINLGGTGASGTLTLNGPNGATFDLGYGGGSGSLTMANSSQIVGSTGTEELYVDSGLTLSGAGTISGVTPVNAGTIQATGGTLTIQPVPNYNTVGGNSSGSVALVNQGSMQVASGSTLNIDLTQAQQVSSSNVLNTGTISVANGGKLVFTASTSSTPGLALIDGNGTINVGAAGGAGGSMVLSGQDSSFEFSLNQGYGTGTTGKVYLLGTGGSTISGQTGTELLDNNGVGGQAGTQNNTISGSGTISNLTFLNNGNLIVTGQSGMLIKATPIDNDYLSPYGPGAFGFLTDGYVEVTSGSKLTLDMSGTQMSGPVAGQLAQYPVINAGLIAVDGGATLNFTAAPNQDAFIVNSSAGTFANSGSITVGTAIAGATIQLNGQDATFDLAAFSGEPGTLTLSDNAGNAITGITGTEFLVNDLTETLSGAGTISNLAFENDGAIVANGTNPLIIKANANAFADTDTGEAKNSFGFENYKGTVQVNSGSTLVLDTSASQNANYGIENENTITVNDGGTLTISAAQNQTTKISNTGTISIGGTNAGGKMTLSGQDAVFDMGSFGGAAGSLTLSNNAGNAITGSGTQNFINDSGSTLSGAGTISKMSLANIGAIVANGSNALVIQATPTTATVYSNPANSFAFANFGTVTVESKSTLELDMSTAGSANYAVGNLGTMTANSGGTLEFTASNSQVAHIINSGTVSIGGTMSLNGTGATFDFGKFGNSQPGSITLTSGSTISGFNGSEKFINDTGSTLSGSGTISNLAFTNNGTVTADTLTITPNSSGVTNNGSWETVTAGLTAINGNLANNLGAIFNVDGGLYIVSNVGPIPIPGGSATISTNMTNGGTVNLYGGYNSGAAAGFAPGASMSISGNLTNSGTVNVMAGENNFSDGSTLGVSGNLTNSGGDIEVMSGTVNGLAYGGSLSVGGTLTNSGTLHLAGIGAGQPFDATGYVTGAGGMTNSGTVKVDLGALLQITNTFTQTAGNTNVIGKLSAPTVAIDGGTLLGNGTVAAATTTIGGTLMPGQSGSAGSLLFTGNVGLDGIFDEQIGGTSSGQSSFADITGNLTLGSDSTLALAFLNGFAPGSQHTYTIMDVTGTIAGDFSNSVFELDDEMWYIDICNGLSGNSPSCAANDPSVILTNVPVQTSAAPEPVSLALFGLGIAGIGLLARSRRKKLGAAGGQE